MSEALRDFQRSALGTLAEGRSILVIAPTGLGKTRAALLPHINAKGNHQAHLGTRLIYSLPLRALTQGVKEELEGLFSKQSSVQGSIAVHHGEEPESRIFSESSCITTVDQYFTAFAGAPLSFAMNSGHAVSGAILTSYSVFDEVHLLSAEKGLPLLFAILKLRERWGLASAVMTATLPESVIEYFTNNLGLEKVEASSKDIQARDRWRKVHIEHKGTMDLDHLAKLVQEKFASSKKIIVFINTVDRAIQLYRELKDRLGQEKVLLIHSRFTPEHREAKEHMVNDRFGKGSQWEGVLITTQVCEAGMNISAPVVISELAPADSLIQRAGRCIRFPENGEIHGEFIAVSPKDERPHQPYDEAIVKRTQEELQSINEKTLTWEVEKSFIHDALNDFYKFFVRGEQFHDKKTKDLTEPTRRGVQLSEAIGAFERAFRRGAPNEVESKLRDMVNVQAVVADSKGLFERKLMDEEKWPAMVTVPYGVFLGKSRGKDVYLIDLSAARSSSKTSSSEQADTVFVWGIASKCNYGDILPGRTYMLLTEDAGYSHDEGLTFEGAGEETGWTDPKDKPARDQNLGRRYQSFETHSRGIYQRAKKISELYKPFVKNWARKVFADIEGANPDVFTESWLEAVRIAALFHDVGKLSRKWQENVGWQQGKELIGRTKERRRAKLPKHAPYAYIFVRALLRKHFNVGDGYGRILDHIALAAARHHSIEVMGDVEPGFESIAGAEEALESLGELVGAKELVRKAFRTIKAGSKGDEPPGPSDDFYFLYCIVQRLIKVADWEDAADKVIELEGLRR